MTYLILALLPLASFAADLTGKWNGPGTCFLDVTHACAVQADLSLLADGSLLTQHCSQDAGSPVQACFVNHFTIQNQNELWLNSQELGLVKVGSYAAEKISFTIVYFDQTISETYELTPAGLQYSVDYGHEGKSLLNETGLLQKAAQ